MPKARVAVIRCDTYDTPAVDAAVSRGLALLGGAGAFVRAGEHIVLKPNLLVASAPDKAVTTHPAVFSRGRPRSSRRRCAAHVGRFARLRLHRRRRAQGGDRGGRGIARHPGRGLRATGRTVSFPDGSSSSSSPSPKASLARRSRVASEAQDARPHAHDRRGEEPVRVRPRNDQRRVPLRRCRTPSASRRCSSISTGCSRRVSW